MVEANSAFRTEVFFLMFFVTSERFYMSSAVKIWNYWIVLPFQISEALQRVSGEDC